MHVERRTIASFDGTPLAVHVAAPADAADAPVLLLANGLGATLHAFRFVLQRFPRAFRVATWDYRGTYGSARPVRGYAGLGVEEHARDALAVADAVAPGEEVHALGWSAGVHVLCELARTAGDRLETLVLHNGAPAGAFSGARSGSLVRRVAAPALAFLQQHDGAVERAVTRAVGWPPFVDVAIRAGLVHHDVDRATFLELARGLQALDMHVVLEIARRLGAHDASDVLPTIACPTLVVQGTNDPFAPLAAAQRMAAAIPGARLALLPGGTHYAAVEMPALLNEHLEEFWRVAGIDTTPPAPLEVAA